MYSSMNADIEKMIESQRYWDEVLKSAEEINRKKKTLAFWENDVKTMLDEENNLKEKIKSDRGSLKKLEMELAEKDSKIKKLSERKTSVQNERELHAVDSELELIQNAKNDLEEKIFSLMDGIDHEEEQVKSLSPAIIEKQAQAEKDIAKINEEINELEAHSSHNTELFQQTSKDISPQVKSRFLKLINSREGKAIATVKSEICMFCNFKIPASLAIEAAKGEKPCICTNCGRYIYARS